MTRAIRIEPRPVRPCYRTGSGLTREHVFGPVLPMQTERRSWWQVLMGVGR